MVLLIVVPGRHADRVFDVNRHQGSSLPQISRGDII